MQLTQHSTQPTDKQLADISAWIMVFPSNPADIFQQLSYGAILSKRYQQLAKHCPKSPMEVDLPNGSHISFVCLSPDISSFAGLTIAKQLLAKQLHFARQQIGIFIAGFDEQNTEQLAEMILSAVLSAYAELPQFKRDSQKNSKPHKIKLFGCRTRHGFRRSFAEAQGNTLARRLSILPPNYLTPTHYVREIRQLARTYSWQMDVYDIAALKRKKAGAFLAVAQGSPNADACIIRLRYKPRQAPRAGTIALVGKGLCYDTGGVNLKPAAAMYGMHEDMQGSAVALGSLLALTEMGYRHPVHCWLAIATNHIGPKAYKPNDVVYAADGTSIEVVHTDAEGRMVLADTLALASRQRPTLIIDYATLTGTCIYALGTAYSGVFSNRDDWLSTLVATGRTCGERVWPFPLDDDYNDCLKSDIADIKQCAQESGMDHILAACFLQRFVKPGVNWIHIDLSSSHRKGGLAHIPTATTGFGVRYTLALLMDQVLP